MTQQKITEDRVTMTNTSALSEEDQEAFKKPLAALNAKYGEDTATLAQIMYNMLELQRMIPKFADTDAQMDQAATEKLARYVHEMLYENGQELFVLASGDDPVKSFDLATAIKELSETRNRIVTAREATRAAIDAAQSTKH